jgi:hypothetical protein
VTQDSGLLVQSPNGEGAFTLDVLAAFIIIDPFGCSQRRRIRFLEMQVTVRRDVQEGVSGHPWDLRYLIVLVSRLHLDHVDHDRLLVALGGTIWLLQLLLLARTHLLLLLLHDLIELDVLQLQRRWPLVLNNRVNEFFHWR